jgi:tetraacyldisaccharide 4'-kinase
LYDFGIFSSSSFQTKTICVGNLSVGGTGKTPMIELLVASLKDDYKIAVLSRGYKRKSSGFLLATDQTTVENLGDEPYQLKSKFPSISVAVDADRRNGITQLETIITPDVILLDDAFQHRKVKPDFSMLLTAYGSLYIDDWYLPTGNLRDSRGEAGRADIIVVTKCPQELSISAQNEIRARIRPKAHQKILFSYLYYNKILKSKGEERSLNDLRKKHITLVTGIANPYPLVAYLKEKEVVFDHMEFNDHHFFTERELAVLKEKECVLTTEKDYVRLKNELSQLFYIEVSHQFLGEGNQLFEAALQQFMTRNS